MRKQILAMALAWPVVTGVIAATQTPDGVDPVDFTPHGTQPGLVYFLNAASDCSGCHGGPASNADFMPYPTWSGSMMANATRDPLFWAALDVANNDIPGVGDFCLKCHTPMAWYGGRVAKTGFPPSPHINGQNGCELFGYHDTASDNDSNDYQGVNCHTCHRVDSQGPAAEPFMIGNADIWLDDSACNGTGAEPCRKGPYTYSSGGPPHEWEQSHFLGSSAMCGTCHDVSSPEIDDNGSLSIARRLWDGGVETAVAMPIERTYSEWNNSRYSDLLFRDSYGDVMSAEEPYLTGGESCQSCHMRVEDSSLARACVFDAEGFRTNDMRVHEFAGGNTWIPQVLKGEYGAALGRSDAYDRTTTLAEEMLQMRSALVDTSLTGATASELNVAVKVTNLSGHKLPTGYAEGRRMWLHLEARDGNDVLLWESGAYNAATGVLTEDAQIRIYETLQGIWDSGTSSCVVEDGGVKKFHFVLNNCVAKDNRIPPLGFRGGADLEMKPVGISYPAHPEQATETVNYDVVNYTVPVSGAVFPVTVTATLKFQVASKDYIDFLAQEAIDHSFPTENAMCSRAFTVGPANQSRGAFMQSLWQDYGRSAPVDMVSDAVVVSSVP